MEPRPPKTSRPASGTPPVFTPPPVPTAERLAARSAWLDEQPPVATGQGRDERGALDLGSSPTIPPSQARSAWFDPSGEPAAGTEQAGPRSPLMPVVSPRGERRSRFLGPLLSALLLILVVGGAAFAVDKARDGNDQRGAADATRAAQIAAPGSPPAATSTTAAGTDETPTSGAADTAAAPPQVSETPAPAQGDRAAEETTPTKRAATKEPTPRPSSLRAPDFLPAVGDLPEGFEQTDNGKLSKDDVIVQLGDNGGDLLAEWEWRENAFRYFAIPEAANPDPKAASQLTVSVHRFRNKTGATAALTGLADIVAANGYAEADVDKIGDQTRALKSETADGNLYVLYVRTGNFVIRLGGFSASGDSSAEVIALAEKIVGGG
ncbi:MAG: hypothetical protein QOJ59_3989 [Thermomicrobiales bacterium]|jgi:hypothetical protein|nr:hypothetical protein [Thermomicrobiales bacterium]MEA2524135.1 hypothetical protein [Thermomicrobiales bacterium]